ncbi:MAG: hypothetical protein LBP26_05735 [Clostridiales bacterium]|jgi:hypothetical protein|nr:hypothetical protein [Clostridiales bacterium]
MYDDFYKGVSHIPDDPYALAWGLFERTGYPGYYMLLSELRDSDDSGI